MRDNTGLEVQRTFSGGVTVSTERDCFGREVRKSVRSGGIERGAYRYEWGIAGRLLSKENELTGTVMRYDYDRFDFLIRQETTQGSETDVIYRMPDFVGNLFGTPDRKDRKYGAGGKLLEDPDCFYHYDDEGNLIFREFKQLQETGVRYDRKRMEKERGIRCLATGTGWLYEWTSNGMLRRVVRPDGRPVEFRYDALGRRTAKQYLSKVTRWVWDGNVPLHEWSYKAIGLQSDEEENTPPKEPAEDVTTWVFEAGMFVPTAKIQGDKQYSIVSDYLGTPIQMYDEQGNKTWDCTLDIYGKVTTFTGRGLNTCPFRLQGQYEDEETGLYYNRFRYYSSKNGVYISQDPIRLNGRNSIFYSYVKNVNKGVDLFGLMPLCNPVNQGHHIVPYQAATDLGIQPFNSQVGVPALYFSDAQFTGIEHSAMHGYNNIGKNTKPLVKASQIRSNGMSADEWLESLEAHYKNPAIQSVRGDLHLINTNGTKGLLIKANVTPSEAWDLTKEWANKQKANRFH